MTVKRCMKCGVRNASDEVLTEMDDYILLERYCGVCIKRIRMKFPKIRKDRMPSDSELAAQV